MACGELIIRRSEVRVLPAPLGKSGARRQVASTRRASRRATVRQLVRHRGRDGGPVLSRRIELLALRSRPHAAPGSSERRRPLAGPRVSRVAARLGDGEQRARDRPHNDPRFQPATREDRPRRSDSTTRILSASKGRPPASMELSGGWSGSCSRRCRPAGGVASRRAPGIGVDERSTTTPAIARARVVSMAICGARTKASNYYRRRHPHRSTVRPS
jgi:hypothetical protein